MPLVSHPPPHSPQSATDKASEEWLQGICQFFLLCKGSWVIHFFLSPHKSLTLLARVQKEGEGSGRESRGKPRGTRLPENKSAEADVRSTESASDPERKKLMWARSGGEGKRSKRKQSEKQECHTFWKVTLYFRNITPLAPKKQSGIWENNMGLWSFLGSYGHVLGQGGSSVNGEEWVVGHRWLPTFWSEWTCIVGHAPSPQ